MQNTETTVASQPGREVEEERTRVRPHVPLQLVGISAGVTAQAALERTLSSVGADVPFQLTHLWRHYR